MKYYTTVLIHFIYAKPMTDTQRVAVGRIVREHMPEGYRNAEAAARAMCDHKRVRYRRDPDRTNALLDLLAAEGLSTDTWEIIEFEAHEIASSPLAFFSSTVEVPEVWCLAEELYDFSTGCQACTTGAVQKRALRFRPSDLKDPSRQLVVTHVPYQPLVSCRLIAAIGTDCNMSEYVRPIEDRCGRVIPEWSQMCATRTLPRLSNSTKEFGREEDACPTCRRDGFGVPWGKAFEPVLAAEQGRELARASDPWFATWEYFGCIGNRPRDKPRLVPPQPDFVLGKRAIEYLAGLKLRHLSLIPVQFEHADGRLSFSPE